MIGTDVRKAAKLMDRLKELQRMHDIVADNGKGIIGIASALVGDPDNATIADAASSAMRATAFREIRRLQDDTERALLRLGVYPPFDGSDPT